MKLALKMRSSSSAKPNVIAPSNATQLTHCRIQATKAADRPNQQEDVAPRRRAGLGGHACARPRHTCPRHSATGSLTAEHTTSVIHSKMMRTSVWPQPCCCSACRRLRPRPHQQEDAAPHRRARLGLRARALCRLQPSRTCGHVAHVRIIKRRPD